KPEVLVVGADPEGSIFSAPDQPARPYLTEGIGEDFWPETFDPKLVDRYVRVSDRDSFLTARAITRQEGILVGGSSGTALHAALEVGKELGQADVAEVMGPPIPLVEHAEPIEVAFGELQSAPAVLVARGSRVVGVLTRSDLLEFLAHRRRGD